MDYGLYFDEDNRPIPIEWHESMRKEELEAEIPEPISALRLLRLAKAEKDNPEQFGKDLIALAYFVDADDSQPLSQSAISKCMGENKMTTCRRFRRWRNRGLNI